VSRAGGIEGQRSQRGWGLIAKITKVKRSRDFKKVIAGDSEILTSPRMEGLEFAGSGDTSEGPVDLGDRWL
jgi:hypothetical protein